MPTDKATTWHSKRTQAGFLIYRGDDLVAFIANQNPDSEKRAAEIIVKMNKDC